MSFYVKGTGSKIMLEEIMKYHESINQELMQDTPNINSIRDFHNMIKRELGLLSSSSFAQTCHDLEFAQYRMAHEQRNSLHAMSLMIQTIDLQFSSFISMLDINPPVGDTAFCDSGSGNCSLSEKAGGLILNLSKLKSLFEVNRCVAEEYLDIKNTRSGDVQVNMDTFNIHNELNICVQTVKLLTNTNMEINVSGEYYDIITDCSRFHRCMINILSNAIKACSKVHSPKIELSHSRCDDLVKVVIMDNGGGIPEDIIAKTFKTTNSFNYACRDAMSTGLGLPIVRYTVEELLRGFLDIEVIGSCTTITILIPVSCERRSSALSPKGTPTKTILIVDDDEFILYVLENMLKSTGHNVHSASGTKEAIKLFTSNIQIDIILSDLNMPPGENGIQLVKQVRSIEKLGKKPPITFVGLSATSCQFTVDSWKCAGMDLFYPKPLSVKNIPEILCFTRKHYPDDFPDEFKIIDDRVMSLLTAWKEGVQSMDQL